MVKSLKIIFFDKLLTWYFQRLIRSLLQKVASDENSYFRLSIAPLNFWALKYLNQRNTTNFYNRRLFQRWTFFRFDTQNVKMLGTSLKNSCFLWPQRVNICGDALNSTFIQKHSQKRPILIPLVSRIPTHSTFIFETLLRRRLKVKAALSVRIV